MTDQHNSIFFAAVKTTRMPMIVTDPNRPDNPIVFANPAFLSMTGYDWDELIDKNCRLLQGPDTDRETVAEIRRAIERRQETSVEILNYKKNGAAFWNALFTAGTVKEFAGSRMNGIAMSCVLIGPAAPFHEMATSPCTMAARRPRRLTASATCWAAASFLT